MNSDFSEGAEFYEKHLRTFPVERTPLEPGDIPFFGSIPELFAAFRATTGYELRFIRAGGQMPDVDAAAVIPVDGKSRRTPGRLILSRSEGLLPMVDLDAATALAESLAATLGEAYRWSFALRAREAELAVAGLNAAETLSTGERLARRLSMILKEAARAIGCEAAGLYLLDERTTVLKLRSVWGLPEERLTEPPRSLAGALADLEALLGNAVVLNENYLLEQWNAPESFATSVCIPVASESSILGTLWLFSDIKRDFSVRDLSILEIVAGRLAVELERAGLLAENGKQRTLVRRTDELAETLQSDAAPTGKSADGWQFAARPDIRDALPRTFCGWHELKGGKAALSIGAASSSKGEKNDVGLNDAVKTNRLSCRLGAAAEAASSPKAFLNWLQTSETLPSSEKKSSGVTPVFRPADPGRESALFFLAILGKKEGRLAVEQNDDCRMIPFPDSNDSTDAKKNRKIPDGGGLVVLRSEEKVPEELVTKALPSILHDEAQLEAEKLLRLLSCQLEKKGHCKNFTLFVVKSPSGPEQK